MKTARELDEYETLAFETGFKGVALDQAWDNRKPKSDSLLKNPFRTPEPYLRNVYDQIQGSRHFRGDTTLPEFDEWIGPDVDRICQRIKYGSHFLYRKKTILH